ncbi:MAG: FCD domain-containing protein [Succinivibrio sp.]|nr:FCD domain-containing protein [Succinivibrio sp.]
MTIIQKTSVSDQLTDYFKQQIDSGSWKVGELIPSENTLTRELGVSRSSLRTVISKFTAMGVLRGERGRGNYLMCSQVRDRVTNFQVIDEGDFRNIVEILEFRLLIEPHAAKKCAALPDKERHELSLKLEKLLKTMEENLAQRDEYVIADLRSHCLIAYASHNVLIGRAMDQIYTATVKASTQLNVLLGRDSGLDFHRQLLKAIADGDEKGAKKAMEGHLKEALRNFSEKKPKV